MKSGHAAARRWILLGWFGVVAAAGCDDFNPLRIRSAPPAAPASVEETFALLRESHRIGAYAILRSYIHPDGREGLIDLLVAADELTAANTAALAAAARACPGLDTSRYDLAAMIWNNLELFSREVELVQAEVDGDRAVLTVQIARRLPLRRLDFERHDGVWQYLSGSAEPEVTTLIRQRANRLRRIARSLDRPMTPEQVHNEFRYRLGVRSERSLLRAAAVGNTDQPALPAPPPTTP